MPRRIEQMSEMRVTRRVLADAELLSYWLPLDDAKMLIRYLNEQIAEMLRAAPERFVGLGCVPLRTRTARSGSWNS